MRDISKVNISASNAAPAWRLPAAVALMLAAGFGLITLFNIGKPFYYLDLQVYRAGGLTWLNGLSLYEPSFPRPFHLDFPLPFTYPPLAAVLFAPVGLLPFWVSAVLFAVLSLLALFGTGAMVGRRLGLERRAAWYVASVIGLACVVLEPIRETLMFGQVNLILMVMIAADCLLKKTPWPRGMMIGLAAAIKLTPLAFLLYFLVKLQWRPMFVAVGSFLGFGALGFLLSPGNSVQYWFHTLIDPGRIGSPVYANNQSVRGVISRIGMDSSVLWLVLALAIAAVAALAVHRLRAAGHDLHALLVVATAGLLASPVSWSHHWVWIGPVVVLLAVKIAQTAAARVRLVAIGLPLALIFGFGPHQYLPKGEDQELKWTLGQNLLGNSYVLVALVFIVVSCVYALRLTSSAEPPPIQADPARAA
ncbi:glycosyltransferase 87 family protein [Crossiella sp. CA-258035]|uniref:glycosyltransferase 87 family protein n=1 Tax=Crossiella sp. CA-258035 TaxID=2981138 RepID=UPI0024BCEC3E|nr:glycosyltransferase 87 family protein [Crossiella sp. CA-258035]WHT17364.1 glycosyltransferase 87 family protein [Crossiella sp. CA-258035]